MEIDTYYFTKWVEAVPLPSKSAVGVANSLFKVHNLVSSVAHDCYLHACMYFLDFHE